ncbi:MAG: short-chain dehydrogenase [marine bacterium B5-7]|nr:MAG: short-chain dehydrogenase [marine bacterium B5-7]
MLAILKNIINIDLFRPAFRIFFLAGSLYAVVAIFVWLLSLQNILQIQGSERDVSWHVHEMLYGFVGIIITGYLLTTISRAGSNKHTIFILFLFWFMGRLVMNYYYYTWSTPVLFTIDSLFLLTIASLVIRDLIVAGKKDYILLIPILFLLPTINIFFHFGNTEEFKINALLLLNHMVILMITIIGGRLIPSLTLSWLRSIKSQQLPVSKQFIEMGVILATVITGIIDMAFPNSMWLSLSAFIAALFHASRLWGWCSYKVFLNFSLLIVHIAYAWLVAGYIILTGCYFTDYVNHSSAMHVLNIGTIGTMILAVMARLSIRFQNKFATITTNVSFLFIFFAVILRLTGSFLMKNHSEFIMLSGVMWMMAFIAFSAGYLVSIYSISVFKKNRINQH